MTETASDVHKTQKQEETTGKRGGQLEQVEGINVLRKSIAEAFVAGRSFAASGLSSAATSRWIHSKVALLAGDAPGCFSKSSPYRSAAVATLAAAVEAGHASQESHPDRSPLPHEVQMLVDTLTEGYFLGCILEKIVPGEEEAILNPPELAAKPCYSVVTDEGVHRIRSNMMPDEDGHLFQLIVVRVGEEVTVYRRYCGEVDASPVAAGYTVQEMNFLALAFAEIRAARNQTF